MIKLTFCLVRRPELTRESFQDYWLNQHAPLVRKHSATLGIRRYVQLHGFDPALSEGIRNSRGGPEQYDGVAELWWGEEKAIVERDPDFARTYLVEKHQLLAVLKKAHPTLLARAHDIIDRSVAQLRAQGVLVHLK